MSLEPGCRLGVYEIVSAIGAGGMGEVYRAHDTSLGRDVAIKVLPDAFASDGERLARFEREARLLASLNHPNIAAIYGLERSTSATCLVMELAAGETLAARIARGRMPLDEALPIALQVASGLEAAHERGIVHRDLKPANIVVAPGGRVKILDFGLAKELGAPPDDLSHSPTMAPAGTIAGVLLGTAAYMSPEQARARPVDARTDIWAYGCVLFEMLAGRPAFSGETLTDIVAAVVTRDPDWASLPAELPSSLGTLLRQTLKKDPVHRIHHIADARLQLEDLGTSPAAGSPTAPAGAGGRTRRVVNAAAWLLAAGAVFVWQRGISRPPRADMPAIHLELTPPNGVALVAIWEQSVCISPDGTTIGFVGERAGVRQVYLKRLGDMSAAAPTTGTERSAGCFFSTDGRALGVPMADRDVKRISLIDGQIGTITRNAASIAGGPAWAAADRVVFGRDGALWQIGPEGGSEARLTTLDAAKHELLHMAPAALPGSDATLFTVVTDGGEGNPSIEAVDASGMRHQIVTRAARPIYARSGHLVFFRDNALMAAPFDVRRLTVTGPAVKAVEGLTLGSGAMPIAALSTNGTLIMVPAVANANRLVWVTRDGIERAIGDSQRAYASPRLAPDGRRIVVIDPEDVWVHETTRDTQTRLGAGAMFGNSYPVWSPDGANVVIHTSFGMRVLDAGGSRRSSIIPGTTAADYPTSISPDGHTLVFHHQTTASSGDIHVLSLGSDDPSPRPLVVSPAYESAGVISPDGHWLAYVSDESGRFQVYLRGFPGPDQKWAVSPQEGTQPQWSRDGRELFYRNGNRMMAAALSPREMPPVSAPRLLFDQRYAPGRGVSIANYDVAPDGRFVMVKDVEAGRLDVVLNWFTDLNRLAPVK